MSLEWIVGFCDSLQEGSDDCAVYMWGAFLIGAYIRMRRGQSGYLRLHQDLCQRKERCWTYSLAKFITDASHAGSEDSLA